MPERLSTTIFMEGASRSGKTTLLKAVENLDVAIIYKDWPANLVNPPTEFFLERDEDKLARAKKTIQPVKLVDRGYLSTLTFYSVLEERTGISAKPVYKWFESQIGKKLYRPDHYIFIDVPPAVTIERYNTNGGLVYDNNMWIKFPERIEFWYSKLLSRFEPTTPVYHIDGNREPKVVLDEFKSLLNNLTNKNVKLNSPEEINCLKKHF